MVSFSLLALVAVILTSTVAVIGVSLLRRGADQHTVARFSGLDHDVRSTDDVPDVTYNIRSYLAQVGIATLDVSEIAAFWYAGRIHSENFPVIAADLLESGVDSKHLRVLAGTTDTKVTRADIEKLVDQTLGELGLIAPMPESMAQIIAARHLARNVIDGRLDALDGACMIADIFHFDLQSPGRSFVEIYESAEYVGPAFPHRRDGARSSRGMPRIPCGTREPIDQGHLGKTPESIGEDAYCP